MQGERISMEDVKEGEVWMGTHPTTDFIYPWRDELYTRDNGSYLRLKMDDVAATSQLSAPRSICRRLSAHSIGSEAIVPFTLSFLNIFPYHKHDEHQ
jgi:hypothetical protein